MAIEENLTLPGGGSKGQGKTKARRGALYSGSPEQMHEQVLAILPLLQTFCTTGVVPTSLQTDSSPPRPANKGTFLTMMR